MMSDETPPLDEVRLEQMRQRNNAGILMSSDEDCIRAYDDRRKLLVEVYRLRAREAAVLAIVREVAQVTWSSYCPWCHRHGTMREVEHDDNCPVLAARAITGITPTEEDD